MGRHAFVGKFELVPLERAGHLPDLKNGHTNYANRNEMSFVLADGHVVTVFAGQPTDLASIPRVFWPVFPPDGPWARAAVFHDAGYRSQGTYDWYSHHGRTRAQPYSRAEVDDILRQAMVELGVPAWKRWAIYSAVRAFGGAGWGS